MTTETGSPAKVMVVEDKAATAMDLKDCLEELGYDVTSTVATGEESVTRAAKESPDVVLMDIHLQGKMDGIEAAREISSRFSIPVVFLTAYTDEDLVTRAEEVGSHGYVVKPYHERELHGSLRLAVSKGRTERKLKAADQEFKKAFDDLEERVRERTEELFAANEKLQELDRLKSMFIASMSHELRTPLNSILGFTGVILQGLTGEITGETRKQLGMVNKSGKDLLGMINSIIDTGRLEANLVEIREHNFDLIALVREEMEIIRPLAEAKLALTLEAPEKLLVLSDEIMVRQIVASLLSNAVKFTDSGKVRVRVGTHGYLVTLAVRDTGIGIRRENLEKLFNPFGRIHEEGLPRREGAGLGLYLARRAATLVGGHITVDSEYGKGSEFSLRLLVP